MAGWHKSTGNFYTPPLCDPENSDRLITKTDEKRELFARVLLRNTAKAGDIPGDLRALGPSPKLPFPRITANEVQRAVFQAGNTSPGSDGITTAVLKTAWPVIKEEVVALFRACVQVGWHPTCFKEATLVILAKPVKKDKTAIRSYRPIALLSVLGKGLERLIAKRLSWVAVKHRVLHSQQFGALPGAFDSVLPGRLAQRLYQQGWPENLAR
ncbi:hypothetical protein JX266_014080 [Neoarthrinium moseri]|nr:hypothetical protein JX266_014080 [Neoarthrinium moseri]